jgi:hypothetical protein
VCDRTDVHLLADGGFAQNRKEENGANPTVHVGLRLDAALGRAARHEKCGRSETAKVQKAILQKAPLLFASGLHVDRSCDSQCTLDPGERTGACTAAERRNVPDFCRSDGHSGVSRSEMDQLPGRRTAAWAGPLLHEP